MKVYVVMIGEYDNYGLYGVYDSMAAALAVTSGLLGYSEIEEVEVQGMPAQAEPSESAIAITRRELGLPPK